VKKPDLDHLAFRAFSLSSAVATALEARIGKLMHQDVAEDEAIRKRRKGQKGKGL
jgi:hypothetical protein